MATGSVDPAARVPPPPRASLRDIAAHGVSQSGPLLALAVLIGVLASLGHIVFRFTIDGAGIVFRRLAEPFGVAGVPLAMVAAGVVLLVLERSFPGDVLGYGFPRFLEMLHLNGARVKRRWMFLKTLGAAISLGAGASVGREGPIAQIGGSIGAAVASLMRMPVDTRRVLIACGTAGGIASTFNAPLAAILFAQEIVLLGEAQLAPLSLIVVAVATAVATTRGVFGAEPILVFTSFELRSYWECVTYALLGVVLGVCAVGYTRLFHAGLRGARRLPWPRAVTLLGGLALVGGLAVLVPQNFADGYPVINDALAGRIPWETAALLACTKVTASVVSLACGAPGGVFGPIFFIGSMLGAAFRALSVLVLPGLTGPLGSYALVGLAGFLAATVHAPLTAVFLVLEMTRDYSIMVPVLLTVGLGLLVSQLLEPDSIDTYGLAAEGKRLHPVLDHHVLERLPIEGIFRRGVPTVPAESPLAEVLRTVAGRGTAFPVVDEDGGVTGMLSFGALQEALLTPDTAAGVVARDLCERSLPLLTPETSLGEAFRRLDAYGVDAVPVVDPADRRRLLGLLSRADLIGAYNRTVAMVGALPMASWLVGQQPTAADAYRVMAVAAPSHWLHRSLREIDCRGRHGVTVLAVRGARGGDGYSLPDPDHPLEIGDTLVLAGTIEGLRQAQLG